MLKRERKRRKKIKKISETAPDSPLHYQRTNDLTVTIFYLEYYFLQLWLRPKHCIYNAQLLIFLVEKSQKRKKEERKKEWKIIIIIIIKLRDTTTFLGSLSTALSVSFISESLSRSFQSRFTIHDRESNYTKAYMHFAFYDSAEFYNNNNNNNNNNLSRRFVSKQNSLILETKAIAAGEDCPV